LPRIRILDLPKAPKRTPKQAPKRAPKWAGPRTVWNEFGDIEVSAPLPLPPLPLSGKEGPSSAARLLSDLLSLA